MRRRIAERRPKGNLSEQISGDLFGGSLRAFVLGHKGKKPPQNLSKIQIRIWELRGQNPRCKGLALINFKSFEKGLAVREGCREEILPMPEIEASFLYPFSSAPLGDVGTHYWRIPLAVLGGCLSPNPSPQPLFETCQITLSWMLFRELAKALLFLFCKQKLVSSKRCSPPKGVPRMSDAF